MLKLTMIVTSDKRNSGDDFIDHFLQCFPTAHAYAISHSIMKVASLKHSPKNVYTSYFIAPVPSILVWSMNVLGFITSPPGPAALIVNS